MTAQRFDVLDEVGRRVLDQAAEGSGTTRAALVEDNHAPEIRVEESPVHRARACTRAAVEEEDGPPTGVADLLPVHDVTRRQWQIAGLERSDLGE
jgi:hypothetical protein